MTAARSKAVGDGRRWSKTIAALLLSLLACSEPAPEGPWQEESGYRWRELAGITKGAPGFTSLSSRQTGIDFTNTVSDSLVLANRILVQGGGVALGDVDHDGRVDIFLCRTDGPNALYRNLGNWRFEDVTDSAGVAAADRFSTGAAFADPDGDGDLDLLLLALGGPNAWFINDGTGRFTEQQLPDSAGSTTATLADVDGDGDLDVYIANYKTYTTLDRITPQERAFDQVVREMGPRQFEVQPQYRKDYRVYLRDDLRGVSLVQRADPDFFYLNEGGGRFTRVPLTSERFLDEQGRRLPFEPEDFGLAARFVDLDADGDPDLYVANDFEDPDEYWINDGRGYFRKAPPVALRTTSNSTMAVDFADIDRDGLVDMFQTDMLSDDSRRFKTQIPTHTALPKMPGRLDDRPQMQRNTLFLNRGDGTFAQVAEYAGVQASGWSWGAVLSDVDLDGWEDILIATGHLWDLMDGDTQERLRNRLTDVDWKRVRWEYPELRLMNKAFRNRGNLTFEDATETWRFGLEEDVSHGIAVGDLDGDGDGDAVVTRLGAPALILRNDATAPRVAVRLKGDPPNTAGIGARIRVTGGPVPVQEREVAAGGLYLSHSQTQYAFAAGNSDSLTIVVDWRDGRRSVIPHARPGRLYEIAAATATGPPPFDSLAADSIGPLFEDRSLELNHRHVEALFDDYSRQLMLPNSMAQLGPGVTWFDYDSDGDDDLILPTGRSGRLAVYRNDRGRLVDAAPRLPEARLDQTAVIGLRDSSGSRLIVGISSYEALSADEALAAPAAEVIEVRNGLFRLAEPLRTGDSASVGPLAAADWDGDGDVDLFVGGRVLPGAYPQSPSSYLYRNQGGRFERDAAQSRLLAGLGMISAALFSDVDSDGDPDLLLAREWGSIVLLLNDQGSFRNASEPWGLAGHYSRWNGIATGDLDGDGRLDLVATSWGRNTVHQADSTRPLLLVFGEFGGRPGVDLFLARHDPRLNAVAPLASFGRLGYAVPEIYARLRSYSAYADAALERVLGPAAASAQRLGATTLDHLVFFNRGGRFEPVSLPREAQLAPAFHAGIADYDGDGAEDLVLTQNFFATEINLPRYDAGRGLLLLGDGRGGLTPLSGQRSGIIAWGEQRGAAHADVDGDGRLDLVLAQNSAPTRFLYNRGARPGLRVRLIGPASNPDAIGAQLRVVYRDGSEGPVREIQAGSGYWSQNGAVQVMGLRAEPASVKVRWPGGKESTSTSPGR